MFIGHLPAGYILSKKLQKRFNTSKYLGFGLLASIIPDIDIFYFYLIDNRQTFHHSYWIHIPFFWLIIGLITFFIITGFKKYKYKTPAILFFSCIILHMVLDTLVGGIKWLYPFSDFTLFFFTVPSVYSFWVYNFIFHWTFLLEFSAIIWAIIIIIRNNIKSRRKTYQEKAFENLNL